MPFNFTNLLNRKFKKIQGKVNFQGIREIPKSRGHFRNIIFVSCGYGLLSSVEIEAGRRLIKKILGKNRRFKLFVRVFPYIPLTGKPSEVRMGRGKGSRIRKWVCFVKPGKIIFEIKNVSSVRAKNIFKNVCKKLSVPIKILKLMKLSLK